MRYYAGIGSRECPLEICREMTLLADELCSMGYWLRSGNADGADQSFASGVYDEKAQIWLPWKEFNFGFTLLHESHTYKVIQVNDSEAFSSVEQFHPNHKRLGLQGVNLMARNYRQIKGLNEDDSEFVICWTKDGKVIGGTGQAIRVATHYNIPIYNMFELTKEDILKDITRKSLLQ